MDAPPAELEAAIQDRWAAVYDEVYFQRPSVHGMLLGFRDYVFRQLKRTRAADFPAVLQDLRLMDVGCGTGELLKLFRDSGLKHLSGVDVSGNMISVASRKCPGVQFQKGAFESIRADAGSLDVIVGTEWLHHLQDLRPVLDRAYDLLKPGGLFCAMEPSKDWLFDQVGIRQAIFTLIFGPLLKFLSWKNHRRIEDLKRLEGDRGYNPWHRHLTVKEIHQAIDPKRFDVNIEIRNTVVPYFSGALFDSLLDRGIYRLLKGLDRLAMDRLNRGEYIYLTVARKA